MKRYDYLVVGAGLYGAVFAQKAHAAGKSVLVVDKRPNIAGNVYTEPVEGIQVHKYGAHIFHTNNKTVWDYVRQFAEFNRFTNSPVANYHGELYSLPFNMRVANVPKRNIGERRMRFLQEYAEANGCTLYAALTHNLDHELLKMCIRDRSNTVHKIFGMVLILSYAHSLH